MATNKTMRIGSAAFLTPQRLLAVCLLASILVHVGVLVWLPGWQRWMDKASAPVLDVVLVAQPQQVVAAEPAPPVKPAVPHKVIARKQEPRLVEVAPQPVVPAPVVAESAPVPVSSATAAPRAAVETKAPPAPVVAPATPPQFNAAYLRNPAPVYPAVARRSGDQGTVMLKVLVNPQGAPVRVELEQSSGSKPLDSAALDAVKGWRFVPARRGERNIEDWVRVPIVFRLEGAS